MVLIEFFDRFIQHTLFEFCEVLINRISIILTRIVNNIYYKKLKLKFINEKFSQLDILYRSENYLIINKPSDLVVNSNDVEKDSVQTILREQLPELMDPKLTHEFYFVHRLDFSTSGILCLPLNKKFCTEISKCFENRKSRKFYIALLNGHLERKIYKINSKIGDDIRYENTNKKMCTNSEFCKNPREAITHLIVLSTGQFFNRPCTKVLLKPITGRRHQLRVHCHEIGHSIFGDYTYGKIEDKKLPRMYLHAIRLIVPNSIENIDIKTDDPFTEKKLKYWKPNLVIPENLDCFYNILDENEIIG